jgi:hypothetical protein
MIFAPNCPHCHQHPVGWWCLRQHSEEFDKQTGQYIKALRLAGAKPIDLVTLLDWSEKRGAAAS